MYTAIYNTLLFFSVCAYVLVDTDGLPIIRQEQESIDDLLAGRDFLQVLLDLPTTKTSHDTTTSSSAVTLPTSVELESYSEHFTPVIRESRSTDYTSLPQPEVFQNVKPSPTQPIIKDDLRKVVNVKISSSKFESRRYRSRKDVKTTTTTTTSTTEIPTTTEIIDLDVPILATEDQQRFVAENNRHEFSVEEMEPITRDTGYTEELPANVQSIPVIKKLSDFEKTSELLKELSQEKLKDKLPPFHHTVIYHDNPRRESPRSVSYSAVVQNIQGNNRWKPMDSNPTPTMSESFFQNNENYMETSSEKHTEPTEMTWGVQQKPYSPKPNLPTIYGQPEQNYEVDEAVSVQTNGRTHGVQTTQHNENKPATKSKNGYVIEGRKERRYRVEERTPDGFIVGEFGIVNHDDGLLRGVRYTADETINPKLIYDTLMKFLSL